MKYDVNVNKDGNFEIHRHGCKDARNKVNTQNPLGTHLHPTPWTVEGQNARTALAVEIIENYGGTYEGDGKWRNEDGEILDGVDAIFDQYGGRVFPCCAQADGEGK